MDAQAIVVAATPLPQDSAVCDPTFPVLPLSQEKRSLLEKMREMVTLREQIKQVDEIQDHFSKEMLRARYNRIQIHPLFWQHLFLFVLPMFVLSYMSMHELGAVLMILLYIPSIAIGIGALLLFGLHKSWVIRVLTGIAVAQLILSLFLLVFRVYVLVFERVLRWYWFDVALLVWQAADVILPIIYIYSFDQIGVAKGRLSYMAHIAQQKEIAEHPGLSVSDTMMKHASGYMGSGLCNL